MQQLRTKQQRQHGYSTFSTDDLREAPAPNDPTPWRDALDPAFDSPRGVLSPHVLTVGHARTRIGQRLIAFCNALTGGFGINLLGFTLGIACAGGDTGPDLASPIRPNNLEWLPECTKVPGKKPSIPEQGVADTGMKCRMRTLP